MIGDHLVNKYGFKSVPTIEGAEKYQRLIYGNTIAQVTLVGNNLVLEFFDEDKPHICKVVACRYTCETLAEVDFLITKGWIGRFLYPQ